MKPPSWLSLQSLSFFFVLYWGEVIAYDREISNVATQIYVNLRTKGQLIAPIDLFIAATAIYCDYTLITANIKHFQNIPNLSYENWYNG